MDLGKGVGGGSLINGMCWTRGESADYDAWVALGNPGWGWNDLLPYFRRVRTHPLPFELQANCMSTRLRTTPTMSMLLLLMSSMYTQMLRRTVRLDTSMSRTRNTSILNLVSRLIFPASIKYKNLTNNQNCFLMDYESLEFLLCSTQIMAQLLAEC